MSALGSFYPRRTNDYVPNMQYAADVGTSGLGKVTIPALPAANATGILLTHNIAANGSVAALSTFDQTAMGRFGRNVVIVANAAAATVVTINGRDYLGQPMSENITLNATTPVLGKKAFGSVDRIVYLATAATLSVGTGTVLGLPYKLTDMYSEIVSGVEATSAGAVVLPVNTQTATSGDPRGTYTPHSSNFPDAVKNYTIYGVWDNSNLYGVPHFYA